MLSKSYFDNLIYAQLVQLQKLDSVTVGRILAFYKKAMIEIDSRLNQIEGETFTKQHLRLIKVQMNTALKTFSSSFNSELDNSIEKSLAYGKNDMIEELIKLEGKATGKLFTGELMALSPVVNVSTLAILTDTNNLLINSVSGDIKKSISSALSSSALHGESIQEAKRRLRQISGLQYDKNGAKLVGGAYRNRLETIARMEIKKANNVGHSETLKEAEKILLDLYKQMSETEDVRTCPFSFVANGTIAKVNDKFKVSISKVRSRAQAMKKSASGIVWDQVGGFYVGNGYPAHFNDRGRVAPFRKSWGLPFQEPEK